MQSTSLYKPKVYMPVSRGYCSLEPGQRIKIRNIVIAAIGLFAITFFAFLLYDGATSLTFKSLKPMDQNLKIAQLVFACIGALYISVFSATVFRKYQEVRESHPGKEAYQGSIAGDLLEIASLPQMDKFSESIWGPFLSDFMNQFKPELLDRYFLLKKVAPNERIEHFRKELCLGCCKGYSLALFAELKRNSKLTSAELKDAIKIENVVYYQLVYTIIFSLFQSDLYLLDYCNLATKGTIFCESYFVDNFESNDLLELFKKVDNSFHTVKKGMDFAVSGCVEFFYINSQEKQVGHAIFIQCSEGLFRFTDSGVILRHFFEFNTQEDMVAGLTAHLKKYYGHFNNIKLKLILLGIPKEEEI